MRSQPLKTLKENQTTETDSNMTKLLPARMNLELDALTDLQIAVLPFPFVEAVKNFCGNLEQTLSRTEKERVSPPYRQLNNGLLACSPTLTHGFEYFFFDQENRTPHFRALAVGTPNNPLRIPTPYQIHELIQIWAQEWTRQLRRSKKNQEVNSICDRFLEAIVASPSDWQWVDIKPEKLVQDLYAEKSLSFQAIPSLLVTLLHEKVCTINTRYGEQRIQWRRVQGSSSDKIGLFLVSNPFRAEYIDSNEKVREGYFAYRLDFRVQTQAGRFNTIGKLKPWIFTHLSCQRYAHEPLVEANYDRDISVLIGMNEARLSDYNFDSTLVRLVIDNNRGEDKSWNFQLPELLAAFKARELIKPETVLSSPTAYGNLDNQSAWQKDEYYIVHAEGYKYQHESRKRTHSIKPGFSLRERGDIIAQVLELLGRTLTPDCSINSDIPAPSGRNTPLAMRGFDYVCQPLTFTPKQRQKLSDVEREQRSREHCQNRQQIAVSALQQSFQEETMHLFLLWRERETYNIVYQQLRDAFLLSGSDDFPAQIRIYAIHIDNSLLLEPLNKGEFTPKNREFYELMRKQHEKKRDAWRKFLQCVIPQNLPNRFAIVEIGQSKRKGVHPRQSIYGAIREACALEKISSQMVQTVQPKSNTENNDEEQESTYTKKTKGRVLNAVLDVTLRQTGALYGSPVEIYKQAGLPVSTAPSLDVIALCRYQKNQEDVHYAIAVRLGATGVVDVILPGSNQWIPYAQAGFTIGQTFSQARSDRFINKKRINSQIKLSGTQLAEFAAQVVTQTLERPTLVLIEADGWRNERGEGNDGKIWPQLKNEYLLAKCDILDFQHVPGHHCEYQRDDSELENLLAVIRLRTEDETPQYIPNRDFWSEDRLARSFMHLSGFCDNSVPELLHYFFVGHLPKTQKAQDTPTARELYMLDSHLDEYGANIAFKHQQIVEMVPFFVHPEFQADAGLRALCRVPHYLRSSPAWTMGNLVHPYPMHLGQQLIEDQLCILSMNT